MQLQVLEARLGNRHSRLPRPPVSTGSRAGTPETSILKILCSWPNFRPGSSTAPVSQDLPSLMGEHHALNLSSNGSVGHCPYICCLPIPQGEPFHEKAKCTFPSEAISPSSFPHCRRPGPVGFNLFPEAPPVSLGKGPDDKIRSPQTFGGRAPRIYQTTKGPSSDLSQKDTSLQIPAQL